MIDRNQIPSSWEIVKLGEVCKNIKPGYPCGNHNFEGIGYLHFRPFNINITGAVDLSQAKFVSLKSNEYFLKEGDVIFNNTNSPKLLGKTCFIRKANSWVYSNHMTRIRVKEYVNPEYCASYLHYLFYKGYYRLHCSNHVNQASISSSFLNKFVEIPLPPLPEQQAIVAKIEELLSDLENGKQQLQTAQQQLKVYRQSLLKWAFEGKLTNKKVKDGELPKGWKWVKFGELFSDTPQNGLYKPSTQYGSGIPIIRIDGFYDGVILNDYDYKRVRLTKEETKKYLLSINDILVNRVNSMSHLGKCGLVKSLKEQTVFESNVMKIQVKKELALPKYITSYLSSSKGIKELTKNAKHAVNQASINQTDVSNAIIPLPPLKEQQLIVDELESKLTVCDKIEETISHSLQQAETLRQSILKKAFEGKLVTQNPNDEPASKLLEKIKAESAKVR